MLGWIIMKVCFKCNIEKPLTDFYKHRQMGDGHLNKCKECTKNDVSKHRSENIERVRAYDRNRPNKEERIRKQSNYHKSGKGLGVKKLSIKNHKEKYPEKYLAKNAVANAIRSGRLVRPSNCEVCGIDCKPQGHHDDYSKKLDVRWLCVRCHNDFHNTVREIYRNLEHTGLNNPFINE